MNSKITYLASLALAVCLTNCTKDRAIVENGTPGIPNTELSLATASVASMGVETLYGAAYAPGALVNATGTSARLNNPSGLQLMPDGTIYVADTKNNAIRKIAPSGEVSTVPIKPAPYGALLQKPVYIGVEQKTGTFHFVLDGFDGDGYDASWIAKSNGDFVQLYFTTYVNATALARDPYTDIFITVLAAALRNISINPKASTGHPSLTIETSWAIRMHPGGGASAGTH
ncbi:MAG: hypothetical protein JKY70_02575 [Mucilaginibacter sp.]|nr:hypothetical protein [Mucilaginibacter sp.]